MLDLFASIKGCQKTVRIHCIVAQTIGFIDDASSREVELTTANAEIKSSIDEGMILNADLWHEKQSGTKKAQGSHLEKRTREERYSQRSEKRQHRGCDNGE